MRTFVCPAQYRPFVEANLTLILAEIGRDVQRRTDEDPRIQAMATVPAPFLAPEETGVLVVTVGDPSSISDRVDTDQDLASTLTLSRALALVS